MVAGLICSTLRYFVVWKGNLKIAKMKKHSNKLQTWLIFLALFIPGLQGWNCHSGTKSERITGRPNEYNISLNLLYFK